MTDIEKMVASSKQTESYTGEVAWKVPDGTCTTNFQLACRCWKYFLNGCIRTSEWKSAALCRPVENGSFIGGDYVQWISVKERLPAEHGEYIICIRNLTGYRRLEKEVLIAYFCRGDWVFDGWQDNTVTHWMPFPKKPDTE